MPDVDAAFLDVSNLTFGYGGAPVVDHLSFQLTEGTAVGLIGPNGAGKSSLINCISGALTGYQGEVWFRGKNVSGWKTHQFAKAGIVRTFQTSRVFPQMTTVSNILLGTRDQYGEKVSEALFGGWRSRQRTHRDAAVATLNHYGLSAVTSDVASSLSGGQRRLLEVARALATKPTLLILDEPFAGVSPVMRDRLRDHLLELRADGNLTLLIVEHRLELIEELCSDVMVMANGRLIARNSMANLREDPLVIEAYIGVAPK